MRKKLNYAMIATTGLLALTPLFAQNQSATALSAQDRKFVTEAAQGGMAEVEMGRVASERGSSADVKAFGRRMMDDHTKANEKLKQVARDKGVTLPTDLPAEMKQERDMLSKLSGAEFDKMYMSHMVKDHQKTVASFEKEAEGGQDQAVRAFAQETLPTLREHLRLAQDTAAKVGAPDDHSGHNH